jgi:single-strand DNA-binding protein
MSRSINKVFITGNLGNDPDISYATSGTAIGSMSVAINGSRKNDAGEWEDTVDWIRVKSFDKQAMYCKDYLRKGDLICIEGHLKNNVWEKDGKTHSRIDIIVDKMNGLSSLATKPAQDPPQESKPASESNDLPF